MSSLPLILIYFTNYKLNSFFPCYFQEQRSVNMLHVTLDVATAGILPRILVNDSGIPNLGLKGDTVKDS